MLQAALEYARRDWPVIPLGLSGKAPLAKCVPHGVSHATTDPQVITEWWSRSRAANIGIATRDLLVVDPDPRNGGDVALAALFAKHGDFPETPTARTGGGGRHYLFRRPKEPLTGKLTAGVDLVHGPRRYFVAAPSIHASGRTYQWITPPTVPLADAPEWLIEIASQRIRTAASQPKTSLSVSDTPTNLVDRARAYVAKIPPAISGQGGHTHTFATCCRVVRGFSLNESEAYAVLSEWNRTCDPPWSERDLRRKIQQAIQRGQLPFGAMLERRSA